MQLAAAQALPNPAVESLTQKYRHTARLSISGTQLCSETPDVCLAFGMNAY